HRALRRAACRARTTTEHDEPWRAIGLSFFREDVFPLHLSAAENRAHEARGFVIGRRGLRRPRRLLVLLAAAGENLRAADQKPRIDAECPADEAEHDDRADAEAAASHREAAAHASAAIATPILDVLALRQIFPAHFGSPSPALGNLCRVFVAALPRSG